MRPPAALLSRWAFLALASFVTLTYFTQVRAAEKFCSTTSPRLCISGIDLDADNVIIQLETSRSAGWVAVGFGSGMSKADIIVGWLNGDNSLTISDRSSSDYVTPKVDSSQDIEFDDKYTSVGSDTIVFGIKRKKNTGDSTDAVITTDAPMNFMWAVGGKRPDKDPSSSFAEHDQYGTFSLKIFGKPGEQSTIHYGSGKEVESEVLVHGILMFIAWAVLCPAAIFFARYLKPQLQEWWFRLHWIILFFGTIGLQSLSLWIIYDYIEKRKIEHFDGGHQLCGIITISLAYAQTILGAIIDRLFDPSRTSVPWWDKMHKVIGRLLGVFAFVTTTWGLFLVAPGGAVIAGYAVWYVLLIVLFIWGERALGSTVHVEDGFIGEKRGSMQTSFDRPISKRTSSAMPYSY